MRAEKRIVNAKKELAKLKQIAAKLHGANKGAPITKEALEAQIPDVQVCQNPEPMQIDSNESLDGADGQNGGTTRRSKREGARINTQWMNQRKIKSIKSKIKKHNQKKTRKGKAAGLSSRRAKKSIKNKS